MACLATVDGAHAATAALDVAFGLLWLGGWDDGPELPGAQVADWP